MEESKQESFDFDVNISNLDDNMTLVTTSYPIYDDRVKIAMSEYNPDNSKYSVYLNEGQAPSYSITLENVVEWATSPQTNLNKIQQINAYVRRLINMNDIVGKVVSCITTNINTEYKLSYSHKEEGRNKKKKFNEATVFIHDFNDNINIKKIIRTAPTTAYSEGNWICYLRHEDPNNYQIDVYPLGVCEITSYLRNGEPVVQFNIQQLRSRLQKTYRKTKKNKPLFFDTIEKEIKANYPAEVYKAFKDGESYVNLDPKYTGVIRVNNQDRQYGVTEILRAIPDLLMLDQLRNTDDINAKARGKKIIHQKMRKELVAHDTRKNTYPDLAYAHKNFMDAWRQTTVVVTSPPSVEEIVYVEPKTELISTNTYNYYRTKVLATLGIGFLMDSGSQSVSTASISVTQLMRTINSITEQLENILFRFYRQALIDNGYEASYTPHIQIIDSEMMEASLKKDFASFYYNTLNTSLETAYEMVGLNIEDEANKRLNEKELGYEEIFTPRMTAYTNNGNSNNDVTNDNVGRPEGDDKTKDAKKQYDKIVEESK